MKPRVMAALGLILFIFTTINYYIGWHGKLFISQLFGQPSNFAYWVCFWILAFSYLIARLGARYLPLYLSQFLKIVGSYWLAVLTYSILLLPFIDISAWVMRLYNMRANVYIPLLGSIFFGLLLLILWRGSWNTWNPIVRKYDLVIPKAAGNLTQLRIAVASDLHLGTIVGNSHIQLLVNQIRAMKPDLILLPGDIIDDDIEPFIRLGMAEQMKELKAPLGTYAVLGNHEYIGGKIKEFVEEMKAIDIHVLMDQSLKIADSFYVIGRKDRAAGAKGRMGLEVLLAEVDARLPLILMDHQPYHLDQSAAHGIDLQLSGHTHRGQMAPFHWITKRLYEIDWGYLKKGDMHTIVSSGYGSWGPPIRLGSRSEIIEIVLQFKP
jgi:predicted MPP superfamily phosphohydrolase